MAADAKPPKARAVHAGPHRWQRPQISQATGMQLVLGGALLATRFVQPRGGAACTVRGIGRVRPIG